MLIRRRDSPTLSSNPRIAHSRLDKAIEDYPSPSCARQLSTASSLSWATVDEQLLDKLQSYLSRNRTGPGTHRCNRITGHCPFEGSLWSAMLEWKFSIDHRGFETKMCCISKPGRDLLGVTGSAEALAVVSIGVEAQQRRRLGQRNSVFVCVCVCVRACVRVCVCVQISHWIWNSVGSSGHSSSTHVLTHLYERPPRILRSRKPFLLWMPFPSFFPFWFDS